jgi:predicted DNA-binding antitoxin AbrB/MazE fold protein
MQEIFRAVYRDGAFVPIVPCDLPEETEVKVVVQDARGVMPPQVTDPEERARIRKEVVARMQRNPIPANAPRFTREELHERG